MTALQLHRLRIGFNGRLEGAQTTMITGADHGRLGAARGRLLGGVEPARRAARRSLPAQIVSVGAAGAAGVYVYVRAVLAMRVPEAHQVSRLIRARLGRA